MPTGRWAGGCWRALPLNSYGRQGRPGFGTSPARRDAIVLIVKNPAIVVLLLAFAGCETACTSEHAVAPQTPPPGSNEQLNRERATGGLARRAAYRGKWERNRFDKWRPALQNYESIIKPENATVLDAANSSLAEYLRTIHNRIHPVFAEQDLARLNGLPKNEVLDDPTLQTSLEIVLDKNTGKIVRLGVTKVSGNTSFDMQTLTSVDASAPFGRAPEALASPDGYVYLHWEFHRDPQDLCTPRNARLFLLKQAP
jgi:hypothetical protein